MNQLGICIRDDDMKKIDTALAIRIITEAGEHRVPVAESIIFSHPWCYAQNKQI